MRTITNIILAVLFITKINFPQQPNFLPLAIGNEYQTYNGTNYFYGEIKRDTVYPNGETYYTLPGPIFEFNDTRVDESGNIFTTLVPFYGTTGSPDEYMIFKADAQEGEIWPVAWDMGPVIDTLYAELLFTDTLFVFGQNRVVKSILLYENGIIPFVFWLADGIGQIRKFYDDGTIVTLNYARINGVVYGTLAGIDDEVPYPQTFSISQNYPNPFNGLTKIDVILPISSFNYSPKLMIYDLLGKTVYQKNLDEIQNQTVTLNTDELGIASGIYFYSVFCNGQKLTKKFALLK